MEEKKMFEELRDLLACESCQSMLNQFPDDGIARNFALACAPETREFNGCEECLRLVVEFVKNHSPKEARTSE
jgi:hypothetical protein